MRKGLMERSWAKFVRRWQWKGYLKVWTAERGIIFEPPKKPSQEELVCKPRMMYLDGKEADEAQRKNTFDQETLSKPIETELMRGRLVLREPRQNHRVNHQYPTDTNPDLFLLTSLHCFRRALCLLFP